MSGKHKSVCPLPLLAGVDPMRVIPPADFHGSTLEDFFAWRFAEKGMDWRQMIADQKLVLGDGKVATLTTIIKPGMVCYFHRPLADEEPVPFSQKIIYEDENIIVVDKPPFLATIPRGSHVTETALVRLRRATGIDTVSPVHRLDRLTAGILLFTKRPEVRFLYHRIFEQRQVKKVYLAKAAFARETRFPLQVRNRIEKIPGVMRAFVQPGVVNAITDIQLLQTNNLQEALYQLRPLTGKTHQLRLHMAGLGVPILNDPLYSEGEKEVPTGIYADYSRPLKLLAARLEFRDPLTNKCHVFTSEQEL